MSSQSSSKYFEDEQEEFEEALREIDLEHTSSQLQRKRPREQDDVDLAVYGPSSFGGWGEYMMRKRAKLQIQNSTMEVSDTIFKGLAIYVSAESGSILVLLNSCRLMDTLNHRFKSFESL